MADEIAVLKGVLLELDAVRERMIKLPDVLLREARTQHAKSLSVAATEAISDVITDIGRIMGIVHKQIAILQKP